MKLETEDSHEAVFAFFFFPASLFFPLKATKKWFRVANSTVFTNRFYHSS
jgi:hypothetical protein